MQQNSLKKEKIIFALDVEDKDRAIKWINLLSDSVVFYKIGLELFIKTGFSVIDFLLDKGLKVMLDLKLYDIPKTVYRAVSQLVKRDISFLTVHGNLDIMKAAVEASESKINILGVTVLTCFDKKDLMDMGYPLSTKELVLKRAMLAKKAGCAGVVASGMEAKQIKKELGRDFVIVTPGIRPAHSSKQDQKRVVTPKEAILMGSDYLVIGRPIRDAKDPKTLIESIQEEINEL